MYLHIGSGNSVRTRDIVGIFDLDTATVSHQSRAFLAAAEKRGALHGNEADLPKSFLLLQGGRGGSRVVLMRLSSASLRARFTARHALTDGAKAVPSAKEGPRAKAPPDLR
ncbi:MAG: DUF370 domain-containing protein [Eubacteriales bacterium]